MHSTHKDSHSSLVEVDTHCPASTIPRVKGHTHNPPGSALNPRPASPGVSYKALDQYVSEVIHVFAARLYSAFQGEKFPCWAPKKITPDLKWTHKHPHTHTYI